MRRLRRQRGSIAKRLLADGLTKVYDVTFRDHTGRRLHRRGFETQKAAQAFVTEVLGKLQTTGTYTEPKSVGFTEYARTWLDGRDVKASTRASYRAVLGLGTPGHAFRRGRDEQTCGATGQDGAPCDVPKSGHPRPHQLVGFFGDRPLDSITTSDVNRYITTARKSLSVKSVRNALLVLNTLLADAQADNYLAVNPVASRRVQKPRAVRAEELPEPVEILSPEALNRLLDAVPAASYALFLTAVSTGARLGELLAFQWGDVDWAQKRIHVRRAAYKGSFLVPKTRNALRAIDVGDQLLAILSGLRLARGETPPPDALLFPGPTGRPLDPDNLRKRVWAAALVKAGLPHRRIHSLRHTFASLLIAQGQDLKYISAQLGHASITTTIDRYGHLIPGVRRDAGAKLEAQLAAGRGDVLVTNEVKQAPMNPDEPRLTMQ